MTNVRTDCVNYRCNMVATGLGGDYCDHNEDCSHCTNSRECGTTGELYQKRSENKCKK